MSARAKPTPLSGAAAVLGSVAIVTLAIYGLREITPVVSTGVVYLLAVLLLSIRWGMTFGLITAVVSAIAFNFFHLPPTGQLEIAKGENWVALAIFLVVAAVTSRLADDARSREAEAGRRRHEADVLAELAKALLAAPDTGEAAALLAARLSEAFELPSATVQLRTVSGDARQTALPLISGDDRLGTLLVPSDTSDDVLQSLGRLTAPLASLLVAARRRGELESEVIEARALKRSDVVKTTLLRSVSHDLRSPLTAIVAAAEGLAAGGPGSDELTEVLAHESRRMVRMVDDLLDLSRIEAGSATPHADRCSVDEVLEAVIADLPPTAPVSLSVEEEIPLVWADPAQLGRAFANVIDNALRHAPGQPVTVSARRAGHRLRVRVSDTGPGIPRDLLDRVFEPFWRDGDRAGGAPPGSGLGLAIARGFVEANDGRIWAESPPGQGASMVVELPIRVRPAPDPAATVGRR